jgi:hypothetical protein
MRDVTKEYNHTRCVERLLLYHRAQLVYSQMAQQHSDRGAYAARMNTLCEIDKNGAALLPREFGEASDAPPPNSNFKSHVVLDGYLFHDLNGYTKSGRAFDFNKDASGREYLDGFALLAYPSKYGRTGLIEYVITTEGIVYGKDNGNGSIFDKFPDVNDNSLGWKQVE